MKIQQQDFGMMPDGRLIQLHTMSNSHGMSVSVTEYGATITSVRVPDKNGSFENVVLGFNELENYLSSEYRNNDPYFGAAVGRFANRIKGGRFKLNGKQYQLSQNDGMNMLHGGYSGFSHKVWYAETEMRNNSALLRFYLESPDGEEGFPGNLKVTIEYILDNENSLSVYYSAVTDKDTIINLTNHSYFNLRGAGNGDIKKHQLKINSRKCLELETGFIPTGKILDVTGSDLDFQNYPVVGDMLKKVGNNKDVPCFAHTWVFRGETDTPEKMSELKDPESGRYLEIYSDSPGLLLYTGDFLDGSFDNSGTRFEQFSGLCLEPQRMPDAPNQAGFPSAFLAAGDQFKTKTIYKFGAEDCSVQHIK